MQGGPKKQSCGAGHRFLWPATWPVGQDGILRRIGNPPGVTVENRRTEQRNEDLVNTGCGARLHKIGNSFPIRARSVSVVRCPERVAAASVTGHRLSIE